MNAERRREDRSYSEYFYEEIILFSKNIRGDFGLNWYYFTSVTIGEMYYCEYYIIDKKYKWLLAENHHNYLIGLGEYIADRLWKYEITIKPIGVVMDRFILKETRLILSLKFTFDKISLITGDKIKLVKPNGDELLTQIDGVIFETKDVVIENNYLEKDIPIGTEIWLIESKFR